MESYVSFRNVQAGSYALKIERVTSHEGVVFLGCSLEPQAHPLSEYIFNSILCGNKLCLWWGSLTLGQVESSRRLLGVLCCCHLLPYLHARGCN